MKKGSDSCWRVCEWTDACRPDSQVGVLTLPGVLQLCLEKLHLFQHQIPICSHSPQEGASSRRIESKDLNKYVHTYFHSSSIYSSQEVEATHVPSTMKG